MFKCENCDAKINTFLLIGEEYTCKECGAIQKIPSDATDNAEITVEGCQAIFKADRLGTKGTASKETKLISTQELGEQIKREQDNSQKAVNKSAPEDNFTLLAIVGSIAILLGIFSLCSARDTPSRTGSYDSIVGNWRVYGASSSVNGQVHNASNTNSRITFSSDGTFTQNQVWSAGNSGRWRKSGSTYTLTFDRGSTRIVTMRNNRLYTNISGMYWWLSR